MPVKQTPDGRYYVQYRVPSKTSPVKEYFGRGKDAKRSAEIREAEINLAKTRHQMIVRPSGMYLDELAQHYLDYCKTKGKSERYRKDILLLLNNHLLPMLSHKPVDRLDFEDMMQVAEKYADRSQATRNRYFDYMKAIFRFGIDQELTTNNPLRRWKKEKEPRRKVLLTPEDLRRIYDHAAPHLQWAIEVCWNIGTRPGETELLSLRWSDIDFENSTIRVRGTKTATSDRLVHFNPEFRARLLAMRQKASTDYLVEYRGQPMRKIRNSFRTACRRAGITYDVRPYDIRHLNITIQLAGGADIKSVSERAGHADIKTTLEVYYHCRDEQKAEAATKIKPLFQPLPQGKIIKIR